MQRTGYHNKLLLISSTYTGGDCKAPLDYIMYKASQMAFTQRPITPLGSVCVRNVPRISSILTPENNPFKLFKFQMRNPVNASRSH